MNLGPSGPALSEEQQLQIRSAIGASAPATTESVLALLANIETHVIAFCGDSVMSGVALGSAFMGDRLIARSERFHNAELLEFAQPGRSIHYLLGQITPGDVNFFETDFADRTGTVKGIKKICFLGTAVNDIADRGRTAAQALASMEEAAVIIRAAGFLVYPFSCPDTFAFRATINDYNVLLRASVIAGNFDGLVDIARIPYELAEYVHPSAAGTEMIVDEMLAVLAGNPMKPAVEGVLAIKTLKTINSVTAAAAAVVTTTAPHGLTTGDVVYHFSTNSTPAIDGARRVTVLSSTTYSVPVTTTVAGDSGFVQTTGAFRVATAIPFLRMHTYRCMTVGDGYQGDEVFELTNMWSGESGYTVGYHSIANTSYFGAGATPMFLSGILTTVADNQKVELWIFNKDEARTAKVVVTLASAAFGLSTYA
jgi:hypothetical protein